MKFNTAVLHEGIDLKERYGSTLPPIYQTSAFFRSSAEEMADIFAHKAPGFNYTRTGNPTISTFENRICKLEGGVAAIASSSGMAAISNAIFNIVRSGDEIVSSASLYGGTYYLLNDIKAFGITTKFVPNNDEKAFEAAINEKTKLIYAETIGNPCLDVTDIKLLASIANRHGIPLIIDNTMATPYLVKPFEYGAHIVVHSSSKYINGNSDAISGILIDSGNFNWFSGKFPHFNEYRKFGKFAFTAKLRNGFARDIGACLSPQNAFLNQLGLETLGIRMQRECDNALALAKWFEEQNIKVNYPGLISSRWNEVANKQFKHGFGAIVTIRVGSQERAYSVMNKLKLVLRVSNIGDNKTLIIHPYSTLSVHSSHEDRIQSGVYEDLLRISVGIEDVEDLIDDFAQALS